MKCICEYCGKKFDNIDDAITCENEHRAEIERKEQQEEAKKHDCEVINELITKFIDEYHEIPHIKINYSRHEPSLPLVNTPFANLLDYIF